MRHAHHDVSTRTRRSLLRARAPLALGVTAALVAVAGSAAAQVGSANVPLPNVLLLLDTSGSFEHMIDGSNPEDTTAGPFNTNTYGNNNTSSSPPQLANCEGAWAAGVPAVPNRWGHVLQALTGTVLNASGSAPFYSCVTMDRITGPQPMSNGVPIGVPVASVTSTTANGLDLQYGMRDATGALFYYPYDSGYYLPYHRPVSVQSPAAPSPSGGAVLSGRCVYSPQGLPGSGSSGGVGLPSSNLSPGHGALPGSFPTDFPGPESGGYSPANAIGTFLYDSYPIGETIPNPLPTPPTWTPNFGYASDNPLNACTFNQATDGIIDQASTLVRFGLMTFDNDPSPSTGMVSSQIQSYPIPTTPPIPQSPNTWQLDNTAVGGGPTPMTIVPAPYSPFAGQWSYDSQWNSFCASTGLITPTPWQSPAVGLPFGCAGPLAPFQVGARNPAAPPWEGRLMGFPNPNADVNTVGQSNALIQTAINSLRPYGATPTAGLMSAAEYYFWGDPTGPGPRNTTTPDGYVSSGCRAQYIILLTDGGPNLDLRPQCQASSPYSEPTPNTTSAATATTGLCPFQLPEDTASILANGNAGDVQTGVNPGTPVFTYVIGFAVSGNVGPPGDAGVTTEGGLANCAQLAESGQLANQCFTGTGANPGGGPYNQFGTGAGTVTPLGQQQNAPVGSTSAGTTTATLESPCCSLQRIAVAGGTQHAYFADTPGDLQAALASVLGDITGQLGSRTLPVAAPTVTYSGSGPLTATYLSSFNAASCPTVGLNGQCAVPWQSNGPWTGDVVRQQYTCPGGTTGATPSAPVASDDFAADLQGENTGFRNFLSFNGWNVSNPASSTNGLTIRPWLYGNTITNSAGSAPPPDLMDSFGAAQTGTEVNNFGQNPSVIYNQLNANNGSALAIQTDSCQDPATGIYLDQQSCANLALSFAMAQGSFQTGSPTGNQALAVQYMQTAYYSGIDHTNTVPITSRGQPGLNAPFGAILDSTPAVVAAPGASVRDDSYQAFASALSFPTLHAAGLPPRNTMLYVATVDGLLHAFDTTAGLGTEGVVGAASPSQVESWAFIPPAVLPHLISNYPGASNILLDGAPVVKDVVFSRCQNGTACGTNPASTWVYDWHTMLVAGFGLGGRGYYALDVTDPRPPPASLASPPTYPSTFPTFVNPATTPPTLKQVGPHFQWQITSVNPVGTSNVVPGQIFGKISGTPSIATVYADPYLIGGAGTPQPQEIGVAILPGGRDGLPTAGLLCARELAAHPNSYVVPSGVNLWPTKTAVAPQSGQSAYNVSDMRFLPRNNVRGWAASCSGSGSAVAGRSVMVVAVATGQILAVFARAAPNPWPGANGVTNDPTAWDVPSNGTGTPLIAPEFLVPTPLDSPMTGKPVVYPSGVGVVAQAAYIGDADGTLWRFDLSDPNPRNWTGAIFADAYSPQADSSGFTSAGSQANGFVPAAPDWTALDSQDIAIEPEIALDTSANVVVNFATGDQTAFNPCYVSTMTGDATVSNTACPAGSNLHPVVNYVYSVREARGTQSGSNMTTPYHGFVNWYYRFPTANNPGERVTGPMAIFNGILYFATYQPPGGTGTDCTGGGPNLYAWDFANPLPTCAGGTSCGGAINNSSGVLLDPNFTTPPGELDYAALKLQYGTAITNTTIIPGVSIASTPSCTTTSADNSDAYTGGSHTQTTPPTPGNYSLMANIGKGKNHAASASLLTKQIQAPTAPTVVDSWAAVSE